MKVSIVADETLINMLEEHNWNMKQNVENESFFVKIELLKEQFCLYFF